MNIGMDVCFEGIETNLNNMDIFLVNLRKRGVILGIGMKPYQSQETNLC